MRDQAKIKQEIRTVQAELERPRGRPARRRTLLVRRSRLLEELAQAQEAQRCTET